MSTLAQVRASLADVLSGVGVPLSTFLPERITPPLIVTVPGDPYVAAGDTFGSFTVKFTLVLLVAKATNETETTDLDELVNKVVDVVTDSPHFGIDTVGQPAYFQTTGTFFSCAIDVEAISDLEED